MIDDHYDYKKRQKLIKLYKKTFGVSCYFIECPYLFLEFIGCTRKRLNIKYSSSLQIDPRLVDSKMMTLPVTGYMQDGMVRRVDVVTFDVNVTAERAKLSLGSIKNIESTLNLSIPKKLGNIFCLSETADKKDPFHIEIIQNQYLIEL